MLSERIFREYDIRGIAEKDLAGESAFLIGKAFGSLLRKRNPRAGRVSVGRDVRLSSESLAGRLMEGIVSAGIDVYDIGVCATPLQYFSLFHLGLDGGVMVTGSHNPPEYNGFKISIGKETLFGRDILQLREIIQQRGWANGRGAGTIHAYDITAAYKEYMLEEFSYLNAPRFKRLKIVVDAGNGTAGGVAPDILRGIGCEVVPLYCEPDGTFPHHHPDPTVVEYLQDLVEETVRSGADMGVGYDGDADRIGVVQRDGRIVWGDRIMIVLSREMLKENPRAKIIGDVKCSQALFDDIGERGGVPVMWKTGHSLIKQKMREQGALLAGEFSGHIFIAHRYFGYDDAIYTTLRLVEIMKKTGKDMKELLSDIPERCSTPEIRLECPDERKRGVVDRIMEQILVYSRTGEGPHRILGVNPLDGMRILFEKGWGLVRTSNTQPVVVMRVEAEDRKSLESYRAFLENEFRKAREEA
ncbi:MAG: phosphomannomutase/phosphoglucomutase [Alphaproteobacteria bacterium]|uniref:Phosphomannomutase/phosphoglucomutase n=1 Tax=Candidatus Nitrobium versatile TaxID=2884831 RepID=A0A953M2M1_9BACT|nr:phosphomannomutase/phosphoglucomutase [Candidatus Nitrobium versatile]